MMRASALCACLLLLAVPVTSVTPIEKVLQMMQDMVAKGTAEKQAEEVKFAAFSSWCSSITADRKKQIEEGTATIEKLKASILKGESKIRQLTDRIQELEVDVGRWTKDISSVTEVRNKENLDYKTTLMDYQESLDALDGAIATLKRQDFDRKQAASALVQVQKAKQIPLKTKQALAAFLQQAQPDVEAMPDERMSYEAPEANAYEFQSGGVVDMLEKLKDQFEAQKGTLMEQETKSQFAFEQIMQNLNDEIENATHEIEKKKTTKGETEQKKAQDEGDLASTTADLEEDTKYLKETEALCAQKTSDFESRQKLRQEELDAINKAIEIIGSNSVAGSGDKHLPTLLQYRKGGKTAFAQLRSDVKNPLQDRIAIFLAGRSRSIDSRLLMQVSQRVAADPFTKVKKMIKDLIVKLMEEATAETEHKGWCDTELTTNKQTRDSKTEEVNKLNAAIEETTAEIAQLTQDISKLTEGVKELDAAMAEATSDRMEAKAKNEETVAEAKDAQTAVEEAMAVLKDFYAKSASATALAQQPAADAPETFDKPYTGMGTSGGNVVDFLEVILSDFARLESDTNSQEATEAEEYDKFMFESKKDKALKEGEIGHKSNRKTDAESELTSSTAELKSEQEALSAAMAYYEKLKPSCVDSGITYEERVKRREEEIQSLQEALKILAGEDI